MDYKKESKELLQKYMDKFHKADLNNIILKNQDATEQKRAEQLAKLVEWTFRKGYTAGLDYCLTQKPII